MGLLHGRWAPEPLVDVNLIAVRQTVRGVRHADDGHQFGEHGGGHPSLLRRRRM
jgi:hypothetical protein